MAFERQFPHQANSFIVYFQKWFVSLCHKNLQRSAVTKTILVLYMYVVGNFNVHDKLFIL